MVSKTHVLSQRFAVIVRKACQKKRHAWVFGVQNPLVSATLSIQELGAPPSSGRGDHAQGRGSACATRTRASRACPTPRGRRCLERVRDAARRSLVWRRVVALPCADQAGGVGERT